MLRIEELTNPNSCINRAKDNELVFVLLARDPAAPNAIRGWVEDRITLGKNNRNDPKIQEAYQCASRMAEFQACMNKGAIDTMPRTPLIAELVKTIHWLMATVDHLANKDYEKAKVSAEEMRDAYAALPESVRTMLETLRPKTP